MFHHQVRLIILISLYLLKFVHSIDGSATTDGSTLMTSTKENGTVNILRQISRIFLRI